jgi:hypothetical protein
MEVTMHQCKRGALCALALATAFGACSEREPTEPIPNAMPLNAIIEVLENAGYRGPAAITEWVAVDAAGTRQGEQMLLPKAGTQKLQIAFARNPGLQVQLNSALNALAEITDPEQIDPNHNTPTTNLSGVVLPSILNATPAVQSQITFTNRFLSYDYQNDRWYVVANGTINSSKVEARDSASGHFHGAGDAQRSLRKRVGYMQPASGSLSSSTFTNTWFAPEFSQEVNFVYNVTEIGGPNSGETNDFYSLEPSATRRLGLVRVPPGSSYDRVGGTTTHPEAFNDWGDPALISGIVNFANAYNRQTGDRTRVNDIGLFFGGRFDLDSNWATSRGSHAEHRGSEFDSRPLAMSDMRKRATYGRLLDMYFTTWIFETAQPHYHARSAASPYRGH